MRNISVKLFCIWTSGSGNVVDISICSSDCRVDSLCNYGRGHYEEHFCEIMVSLINKRALGPWVAYLRMMFIKV